MVRTDFTLWEPGVIVLTTTDLLGPNPYNGGHYSAEQLSHYMASINQLCLHIDTCVTIVQAQSKYI